ncbi:MAG: hypothetical protein K2N26_04370 [Oscillospiraceae bacterium]|nr:hypothetical protein [Oscillospiraceae bacterium]
MSIELFEHNKTAYESAVAMLAETGKAAVIHSTGTGKSFIGLWLWVSVQKRYADGKLNEKQIANYLK